ncbi:sialidase family protein [Micromonospora sp. KC721]|uniref:sialidase family protein n=1 Tax=Micromonospora sp. KC721 TaxID=2530380 RepID=UPI00104FE5BC|nr:sialidase family protein [Micromonospora sp. KC721]TDB79476.1 exo-alpha-sialidase [Micromonospora sp. KC721]
MTELRDLFEEAANSAPPPSRLVADELYAAGRRRRRRRTVANCAAAVALVMTAGTGIAAMAGHERSVSGEAGVDQKQSLPGALPHHGERIQWSGAADARHLYLSMSTQLSCSKEPCAKSIVQLVASDDGGRTWSDRGGPINAANFEVLGPGRLLAVLHDSPGPKWTLQTSTDGGRTWHRLDQAPPVAAVPTGSIAVCWPESNKAASACRMHALDPATRRIAPLTSQPALTLSDDLRIRESAGRLWASGVDPATGRPGVAVSRDAGRTWSTQVFADAPACSRAGCPAPYLAAGDGPIGYAVVLGAQQRVVYRYEENDGQGAGGWQRVPGAGSVPSDRLPGGVQSFVTADGTHVLFQVVTQSDQDVDGHRWWRAGADGTYEAVQPVGLPATVNPIRRTSNGWFYTHSYLDKVVYGSTDGWHWSPVARGS